MQRKNHILKTYPHKKRGAFLKKRSGFAIIMAIAVIVIISTIMALSLALTSQTSKRTTDLYLYEQAVLYSKSAAELALLDIAKANPCTVLTRAYTFDTIYDADITMRYVYTAPSPCANAADNYFTIATPEQSGSVLMDITVSIRADANITAEPIHYFRRTIQKL
jgi:hypothetical protein